MPPPSTSDKTVSLDQLRLKLVDSVHEELVHWSAPAAGPAEARLKSFKALIRSIQQRMLKFFIVLRYARDHGDVIGRLHAIRMAGGGLDSALAATSTELTACNFQSCALDTPKFDTDSALEVLLSGTFSRVPRCIAEASLVPHPRQRVPEQRSAWIQELNGVLAIKLLRQNKRILRLFSTIVVDDASVVLRVEREFQVRLCLMGASPDASFAVLNCKFLQPFGSLNDSVLPNDLTAQNFYHRLNGVMAAVDEERGVPGGSTPSQLEHLYTELHTIVTTATLDWMSRQVSTMISTGAVLENTAFERMAEDTHSSTSRPAQTGVGGTGNRRTAGNDQQLLQSAIRSSFGWTEGDVRLRYFRGGQQLLFLYWTHDALGQDSALTGGKPKDRDSTAPRRRDEAAEHAAAGEVNESEQLAAQDVDGGTLNVLPRMVESMESWPANASDALHVIMKQYPPLKPVCRAVTKRAAPRGSWMGRFADPSRGVAGNTRGGDTRSSHAPSVAGSAMGGAQPSQAAQSLGSARQAAQRVDRAAPGWLGMEYAGSCGIEVFAPQDGDRCVRWRMIPSPPGCETGWAFSPYQGAIRDMLVLSSAWHAELITQATYRRLQRLLPPALRSSCQLVAQYTVGGLNSHKLPADEDSTTAAGETSSSTQLPENDADGDGPSTHNGPTPVPGVHETTDPATIEVPHITQGLKVVRHAVHLTVLAGLYLRIWVDASTGLPHTTLHQASSSSSISSGSDDEALFNHLQQEVMQESLPPAALVQRLQSQISAKLAPAFTSLRPSGIHSITTCGAELQSSNASPALQEPSKQSSTSTGSAHLESTALFGSLSQLVRRREKRMSASEAIGLGVVVGRLEAADTIAIPLLREMVLCAVPHEISNRQALSEARRTADRMARQGGEGGGTEWYDDGMSDGEEVESVIDEGGFGFGGNSVTGSVHDDGAARVAYAAATGQMAGSAVKLHQRAGSVASAGSYRQSQHSQARTARGIGSSSSASQRPSLGVMARRLRRMACPWEPSASLRRVTRGSDSMRRQRGSYALPSMVQRVQVLRPQVGGVCLQALPFHEYAMRGHTSFLPNAGLSMDLSTDEEPSDDATASTADKVPANQHSSEAVAAAHAASLEHLRLPLPASATERKHFMAGYQEFMLVWQSARLARMLSQSVPAPIFESNPALWRLFMARTPAPEAASAVLDRLLWQERRQGMAHTVLQRLSSPGMEQSALRGELRGMTGQWPAWASMALSSGNAWHELDTVGELGWVRLADAVLTVLDDRDTYALLHEGEADSSRDKSMGWEESGGSPDDTPWYAVASPLARGSERWQWQGRVRVSQPKPFVPVVASQTVGDPQAATAADADVEMTDAAAPAPEMAEVHTDPIIRELQLHQDSAEALMDCASPEKVNSLLEELRGSGVGTGVHTNATPLTKQHCQSTAGVELCATLGFAGAAMSTARAVEVLVQVLVKATLQFSIDSVHDNGPQRVRGGTAPGRAWEFAQVRSEASQPAAETSAAPSSQGEVGTLTNATPAASLLLQAREQTQFWLDLSLSSRLGRRVTGAPDWLTSPTGQIVVQRSGDGCASGVQRRLNTEIYARARGDEMALEGKDRRDLGVHGSALRRSPEGKLESSLSWHLGDAPCIERGVTPEHMRWTPWLGYDATSDEVVDDPHTPPSSVSCLSGPAANSKQHIKVDPSVYARLQPWREPFALLVVALQSAAGRGALQLHAGHSAALPAPPTSPSSLPTDLQSQHCLPRLVPSLPLDVWSVLRRTPYTAHIEVDWLTNPVVEQHQASTRLAKPNVPQIIPCVAIAGFGATAWAGTKKFRLDAATARRPLAQLHQISGMNTRPIVPLTNTDADAKNVRGRIVAVDMSSNDCFVVRNQLYGLARRLFHVVNTCMEYGAVAVMVGVAAELSLDPYEPVALGHPRCQHRGAQTTHGRRPPSKDELKQSLLSRIRRELSALHSTLAPIPVVALHHGRMKTLLEACSSQRTSVQRSLQDMMKKAERASAEVKQGRLSREAAQPMIADHHLAKKALAVLGHPTVTVVTRRLDGVQDVCQTVPIGNVFNMASNRPLRSLARSLTAHQADTQGQAATTTSAKDHALDTADGGATSSVDESMTSMRFVPGLADAIAAWGSSQAESEGSESMERRTASEQKEVERASLKRRRDALDEPAPSQADATTEAPAGPRSIIQLAERSEKPFPQHTSTGQWPRLAEVREALDSSLSAAHPVSASAAVCVHLGTLFASRGLRLRLHSRLQHPSSTQATDGSSPTDTSPAPFPFWLSGRHVTDEGQFVMCSITFLSPTTASGSTHAANASSLAAATDTAAGLDADTSAATSVSALASAEGSLNDSVVAEDSGPQGFSQDSHLDQLLDKPFGDLDAGADFDFGDFGDLGDFDADDLLDADGPSAPATSASAPQESEDTGTNGTVAPHGPEGGQWWQRSSDASAGRGTDAATRSQGTAAQAEAAGDFFCQLLEAGVSVEVTMDLKDNARSFYSANQVFTRERLLQLRNRFAPFWVGSQTTAMEIGFMDVLVAATVAEISMFRHQARLNAHFARRKGEMARLDEYLRRQLSRQNTAARDSSMSGAEQLTDTLFPGFSHAPGTIDAAPGALHTLGIVEGSQLIWLTLRPMVATDQAPPAQAKLMRSIRTHHVLLSLGPRSVEHLLDLAEGAPVIVDSILGKSTSARARLDAMQQDAAWRPLHTGRYFMGTLLPRTKVPAAEVGGGPSSRRSEEGITADPAAVPCDSVGVTVSLLRFMEVSGVEQALERSCRALEWAADSWMTVVIRAMAPSMRGPSAHVPFQLLPAITQLAWPMQCVLLLQRHTHAELASARSRPLTISVSCAVSSVNMKVVRLHSTGPSVTWLDLTLHLRLRRSVWGVTMIVGDTRAVPIPFQQAMHQIKTEICREQAGGLEAEGQPQYTISTLRVYELVAMVRKALCDVRREG